MKTLTTILAASLLAFSAPVLSASNKPVVKCHPKVCSNHAAPVETGKGSCKAHPGSCK